MAVKRRFGGFVDPDRVATDEGFAKNNDLGTRCDCFASKRMGFGKAVINRKGNRRRLDNCKFQLIWFLDMMV